MQRPFDQLNVVILIRCSKLLIAICSKSAGSYTLLHLIARILVKWGNKFVFMIVNRCSCLSTDSDDSAIANVADNLINDWFCIFRPCF